ncbi:MAG: hypothetical protein OXC60_17480 [Litoreibacter sp.]|nr:hypothetical protein [Litoreibacter sp.]MCY4336449.1 hypothetical protein [Litoreibacter sp.]
MPQSYLPQDPKGLVHEAYQIEGITAGECRSIFLDWALSVPLGKDQVILIKELLVHYGSAADHPMTAVLNEGLGDGAKPARRGGRAARVGKTQ